MKDEDVLSRLDDIGNCKYDIQVAAHIHKLREDLKNDIEAAQKEIKVTEPSASDNTPKVIISALKFGYHAREDGASLESTINQYKYLQKQ